MREVRVVLDSLDLDLDIRHHWNDLRKNGGRIKFWTGADIDYALVEIERRLTDLFPKYDIRVNKYIGGYTVHFRDIKKELLGTTL